MKLASGWMPPLWGMGDREQAIDEPENAGSHQAAGAAAGGGEGVRGGGLETMRAQTI